MNYTATGHVGSTGDVPDCFMIPHGLMDFYSQGTRIEQDKSGKILYVFHGDLMQVNVDICPACRSRMHVNNTFSTLLRHLPFGPSLSFVSFTRRQYRCPQCGKTQMEPVPFRSEHHRITKALEVYAEELLEWGYTNKEVSGQTGLDQHVVKSIDEDRLRRKYTEGSEGNEEDPLRLKMPKTFARFLMID